MPQLGKSVAFCCEDSSASVANEQMRRTGSESPGSGRKRDALERRRRLEKFKLKAVQVATASGKVVVEEEEEEGQSALVQRRTCSRFDLGLECSHFDCRLCGNVACFICLMSLHVSVHVCIVS